MTSCHYVTKLLKRRVEFITQGGASHFVLFKKYEGGEIKDEEMCWKCKTHRGMGMREIV
jgi:hypothetical protein